MKILACSFGFKGTEITYKLEIRDGFQRNQFVLNVI